MMVDQEWLDWSQSTTPAAMNGIDIICDNACWAQASAIQVTRFPLVLE